MVGADNDSTADARSEEGAGALPKGLDHLVHGRFYNHDRILYTDLNKEPRPPLPVSNDCHSLPRGLAEDLGALRTMVGADNDSTGAALAEAALFLGPCPSQVTSVPAQPLKLDDLCATQFVPM